MTKIHFATQLQKYIIQSIFLLLVLVGCKSLDISNPGPLPQPPSPDSEVNVPFVFPKETLHRIINSQIPEVLLDQDQTEFGSGIVGSLKLTRNGSIAVAALDSQQMTLKLPMRVKGEVGLSKNGLGSLFRGKAPLDTEFSPVFKLNPEINPDWTVSIKDFELLDLGGKLNFDILGMQVDLSGMLERELKRWAAQNLQDDKKLFNLKPLVDLAWEQVGRPFEVNWQQGSTGFSIRPEQVNFKEFFDKNENFTVWLGLNGKIQSHPADAIPSRAFPLPALSPNFSGDNKLELLLPASISYDELDEILGANLNGKSFRVDSKTILTLDQLQSSAFGELLAIETDFLAERNNGDSIEGKLFVVGKPAFDEELQALIFEDINFKVISEQSKAKIGIALKKRKIIRQIEKMAIFPIGDLLEESTEGVRDRLGLSTPIADLQIENLQIVPEGFYPTANGIRIYIQGKGKVGIQWK
ncbi:MAG: DUF4403 family protein [Bacteroidota bacterium]